MGAFRKRLLGYFDIRYAILLVPLCGFAVYDSVFQSFSSILGVLHETYPDIPVTSIQMILAIPPMMSIPGTLLSGVLSSYIRKKRIAEFALIIIFIGGMVPVLSPEPTIEAMFLCSACVGVGQGLLHPLANAIICQRWTKDGERSRVLGFKQAFNYIGEVLVTLCIGVLALTHWENAFLVYLGIIPVFIMTVIFLPKGELDKRMVDRSHHAEGLRELFNPKMLYLCVLFFFAAMCLYGYYTNIALLVQERDMGTTADISGVSSLISIVSFVTGVLYGAVTKRLGRFTLASGFGILAFGMMVIGCSTSLATVLIGGVCLGFGVGVQQISTIFYVSKAVNERFATMAVSLILSCVALGASCAPMVIGFIKSTLVGADGAAAGLLIAAAGYFLLSLVEGLSSLIGRRRNAVGEAEGATRPE